jgi:hypothetical protein
LAAGHQFRLALKNQAIHEKREGIRGKNVFRTV